jgi:hypothetical protein
MTVIGDLFLPRAERGGVPRSGEGVFYTGLAEIFPLFPDLVRDVLPHPPAADVGEK